MRTENENFVDNGSLNTLLLPTTKMILTSRFQKHIHKLKIYPGAVDFTQALLVMLVTNIMSGFSAKYISSSL